MLPLEKGLKKRDLLWSFLYRKDWTHRPLKQRYSESTDLLSKLRINTQRITKSNTNNIRISKLQMVQKPQTSIVLLGRNKDRQTYCTKRLASKQIHQFSFPSSNSILNFSFKIKVNNFSTHFQIPRLPNTHFYPSTKQSKKPIQQA